MTSFGALFGVPKPVIAMLHLGALPGRPQHDRAAGLESIVESVRRDLRALQDAGVDGVLFYSRRTADAFAQLARAAAIGDRLAGVDYFVLSREVADGLAALPGRIHVAARPDEDSLVALIPPPA